MVAPVITKGADNAASAAPVRAWFIGVGDIQSGDRERLGADAMAFEQNSVKRSDGILAVAQNGGWRNSKP